MVSMIPVNGRGEILLQQRDYTPGIAYPGCWTFFGGAVEPDDASYDEAIRREVREELDVEMPIQHWLDYLCALRSIPGELDVIIHVYTGELERPLDSLTLYEGMAMGWFDAEGIEALEFGFGKKPIALRFLREMQHS